MLQQNPYNPYPNQDYNTTNPNIYDPYATMQQNYMYEGYGNAMQGNMQEPQSQMPEQSANYYGQQGYAGNYGNYVEENEVLRYDSYSNAQSMPEAKQEKDWIKIYAGEQEWKSEREYVFTVQKMKKWNRNNRIGHFLDGLILAYILAIPLYALLYWGYNQGVIPKASWEDITAFIICGVFIALFTIIWSLIKCRMKVDNYTVGTVSFIEPDSTKKGHFIIWVALQSTQLPVQVDKATAKIYHPNERVVLYSLSNKPNIRILHLFTKKQRKKMKQR